MQKRVDYRKAAPEVLAAMRMLQEGLSASELEPKLLELVKIRASQLNSCAFCLDMHARDARKLGEDEQRIYQLDAWRDSLLYTQRERAALAWTEAVTRISAESVDDELYSRVGEQFNARELAFLTLAVVAINGWNRLNIAFRTPPAGGRTAA
ncbi:MAG TPA: carboxymuconolactone decarboxylase family protein [Gammaproteobacteria bacterium]|nr:carboxymuconolactone decarboxylase family protein [Gammaproteobacteria bacterium]